MSKTISNDLRKIRTSFLREHGFFRGERSGELTWSVDGECIARISIEVSIVGGYLRLFYTVTDLDSREKTDFDYKVPLVTTPCYFGGHRYWFQCPLTRNGTYCGKRVGVLYLGGNLFGCRHCYNLTYASRNLSGAAKPLGSTMSLPELKNMRDKIKRTNYRGKPTKRFLRYLKKEGNADEYYIGMIESFNDKIKKIRGKKKCKKTKQKP